MSAKNGTILPVFDFGCSRRFDSQFGSCPFEARAYTGGVFTLNPFQSKYFNLLSQNDNLIFYMKDLEMQLES